MLSTSGDDEVMVPADAVALPGRLTLPSGAAGLVVFAHGSGSSRRSSRNQFVARVLHEAGIGTLLFDLLTTDEERDRANVFDIALLARRLVAATGWLRADVGEVPLGYFGASTGAGAALWAAAEQDSPVSAVVSRGGRPDLAGSRVSAVRAPTLLIVGGDDTEVLRLNRQVQATMGGETQLEVVPGASHLFEEPGALEAAAELARDWLLRYLTPPPEGTSGAVPA